MGSGSTLSLSAIMVLPDRTRVCHGRNGSTSSSRSGIGSETISSTWSGWRLTMTALPQPATTSAAVSRLNPPSPSKASVMTNSPSHRFDGASRREPEVRLDESPSRTHTPVASGIYPVRHLVPEVPLRRTKSRTRDEDRGNSGADLAATLADCEREHFRDDLDPPFADLAALPVHTNATGWTTLCRRPQRSVQECCASRANAASAGRMLCCRSVRHGYAPGRLAATSGGCRLREGRRA
jgi:hypothetical protein